MLVETATFSEKDAVGLKNKPFCMIFNPKCFVEMTLIRWLSAFGTGHNMPLSCWLLLCAGATVAISKPIVISSNNPIWLLCFVTVKLQLNLSLTYSLNY